MCRIGSLSAAVVCLALCSSRAARADNFLVPNSDCLTNTASCHGTNRDASDRLRTASRFDLPSSPQPTILSQHNVRYDSDDNLGTIEDAYLPDSSGRVNECKKCHGNQAAHDYVSKASRLRYPDDVAAGDGKGGTSIATAANFSAYQDFCIACHDGVARSSSAAAQAFNGVVPTQQAAPTLASNPGSQQPMNGTRGPATAGGWTVPPVPARDVNVGASPYLTVPPYFKYYEANGHGKATGEATESTPNTMDVTCLSPSAAGPQGCHTPHGSKGRFLVDDLYVPVAGAMQTPSGFASNLCLACHADSAKAAAPLGNTGFGQAYMNFHTMAVHFSATTGAVPYAVNSFITVGHGAQLSTLLPYYGSLTDPVESRVYFSGGAAPVLGTHAISCVTCHDPHGTSDTYVHTPNFNEDGLTPTPNTRGMLRKFPTLWFGTAAARQYQNDPLCGECHS